MTDLTRNAFITIYRMLNDRDRRVFTIYFAMEVRRDGGDGLADLKE